MEKVLAEIITYDVRISAEVLDEEILPQMQGRRVLIVDDSSTARNQVRETLAQLGLEVIERQDGLHALKLLKGWCDGAGRRTGRDHADDHGCRDAGRWMATGSPTRCAAIRACPISSSPSTLPERQLQRGHGQDWDATALSPSSSPICWWTWYRSGCGRSWGAEPGPRSATNEH